MWRFIYFGSFTLFIMTRCVMPSRVECQALATLPKSSKCTCLCAVGAFMACNFSRKQMLLSSFRNETPSRVSNDCSLVHEFASPSDAQLKYEWVCFEFYVIYHICKEICKHNIMIFMQYLLSYIIMTVAWAERKAFSAKKHAGFPVNVLSHTAFGDNFQSSVHAVIFGLLHTTRRLAELVPRLGNSLSIII